MNDASHSPGTLGRYELLTRLATGGMAEILLARETGIGGLERLVVIKRILPEYAEDPEFTEMFLREARIVARINDPNVVQVFELGEANGDYFMAMEYIDGMTVAELVQTAIEQNRWFSLEAALSVVQQACKGLHEVHEVRDLDGDLMGLIHRDVSHQNFMTDGEGFVKLIDFGIAKSTRSEKEATHSGAVKGKYAYMSPEQCKREDLDRRSDIFSLGTVAWELFAGKRLFKREDKLATIEAITEEEIPPPSDEHPEIPEAIDEALRGALRKDPEERYQTAAEFREALLDAAQQRDLATGTDPLGAFVQEVAGELLEDRRRDRRQALENSEVSGVDHAGERDRQTPSETGHSGAQNPSRLGLGLLLGAVCLVAAATGWYVFRSDVQTGGDAAGSSVEISAVTLGWPREDGETTVDDADRIAEHLEERLDRPVEMKRLDSPRTLSERIREGTLQAALMPPLPYVRARTETPELAPLAVRDVDGTSSVEGRLVVRANSGVEQLEDLQGASVCFSHRDSAPGYLLAQGYFLRHDRDPSAFLGPPQWSGSELEVLRELLAERCAAASTSSETIEAAPHFDVSTEQLRTLAETGSAPRAAVVVGPTTDDSVASDLREALLAFDGRSESHDASTEVGPRVTGFSTISDAAFDELRETLRQVE